MQTPFPTSTNPVEQGYVAGAIGPDVYSHPPFVVYVHPVPQIYITLVTVESFALRQFPFPSL